MTNESGSTAISTPPHPVGSPPPAASDAAAPAWTPGALGLALLSVSWLAAMLWSAQREISAAAVDSIAIVLAAYALPGVISASLLSGAAVSLALANLLTNRGVGRSLPRFVAAVGAGLVTGLLAALAVTLSYGEGSAIMVLAGTGAAAATVGGIAGGLRSTRVVAAVGIAGLILLILGPVVSYFQNPVLTLFGFDETVASWSTAYQWFSRTVSMISGLAAGLLTFGYLRLAHRRATRPGDDHPPLRWPVYLIAGAGPGLLLITTELLTRTAGARILTLAGTLSEADQAAQNLLGQARLDHALWVLFLGSLTAALAFGRTLRPVDELHSVPASAPGQISDPD